MKDSRLLRHVFAVMMPVALACAVLASRAKAEADAPDAGALEKLFDQALSARAEKGFTEANDAYPDYIKARQKIVALGKSAVPSLKQKADNANDWEKALFAEICLSWIENKDAYEALVTDGVQLRVSRSRRDEISSAGRVLAAKGATYALLFIEKLWKDNEFIPGARKGEDPIRATSRHRNPKAYVACALGILRDTRARLPLEAALRHEDGMVRLQASVALEAIGDKRSIPALLEACVSLSQVEVPYISLELTVSKGDESTLEQLEKSIQKMSAGTVADSGGYVIACHRRLAQRLEEEKKGASASPREELGGERPAGDESDNPDWEATRKLLVDGTYLQKFITLTALSAMKESAEETIPAVAQCLKEERRLTLAGKEETPERAAIRKAALVALWAISPKHDVTVAAARESVDDPSASVSLVAHGMLACMGQDRDAHLRVIVRGLWKGDAGERASAIESLARLGRIGIPAVVGEIRSNGRSNEHAIGNAAEVFAKMKELGPVPEEAIPALLGLLKEKNAEARQAALWAFARLGEDDAEELRESLNSDDSSKKERAKEALAWLAKLSKLAAPAVVGALDDESPEVRSTAVLALTGMQVPSAAVPALIRELEADPRGIAADALGKVSPPPIEELIKLVRNEEKKADLRLAAFKLALKLSDRATLARLAEVAASEKNLELRSRLMDIITARQRSASASEYPNE